MPSYPRSSPRKGHRQFAARVLLPFEQTPVFPKQCLGCGQENPVLVWKPDASRVPFAGKVGYYLNHRMLPVIEIPVCELCIDHMPGNDRGLGVMATSVLVPAMLLLATLLFFAAKMNAVATLTGLAAVVWFVLASRAVWVLNQSLLFDLQIGKNDHLVYYFRDPEYATKFNELNQDRGD